MKIIISRGKKGFKANHLRIHSLCTWDSIFHYSPLLVNNLETQFRVMMHFISALVKLAVYGVLVKMDKDVQ